MSPFWLCWGLGVSPFLMTMGSRETDSNSPVVVATEMNEYSMDGELRRDAAQLAAEQLR